MTQAHDDRLALEVDTLRRSLSGRVPDEVLDRAIEDSVRELEDARIKDFVPVLVGQTVRRRVREVPGPRDRG